MAPAIRLLVLDVDGVLTDGRLYFGPRGEALKAFHVRDGAGLKQLQRAGLAVAVITVRRAAPRTSLPGYRGAVARCARCAITYWHSTPAGRVRDDLSSRGTGGAAGTHHRARAAH